MRAALLLVAILLLGAVMPAAAFTPPKKKVESEMLLAWTPPRDNPHKSGSVDRYEVWGLEDKNWTKLKEVPNLTFFAMAPRDFDAYSVRAVWSASSAPRTTPICVVSVELDKKEVNYNCDPLQNAAVLLP